MEQDPNKALLDNPYVPNENLYDTGEDDGADDVASAEDAPKPKPKPRRSRSRKAAPKPDADAS